MKGRNEEALLVVGCLHAHWNINDSFVVSEHKGILEQVRLERDPCRRLFGIPTQLQAARLGHGHPSTPCAASTSQCELIIYTAF